MGTGYTRNDTTNNIADGGVIDAADLDGEFDAIVAAFSESTGHTHDGTGAEGAPIEVLGPTQDFIADAAALYPKATSTYALGTVGATYSNVFTDGLTILGTAIVATPAEINNLSGVTSTAAELNILDGVTATAAELNILDGVTSTAAELNILDGVTSTAAELNILDGVTSTAAELNILDGVTATTVEINHLVGQDQGVATTDSPAFTGVTINEDVILNSDLAKVTFGADSEIQLEHSADEGLKVKNTKTTAATPVRVTLESSEGTLTANDEIASIDFDSNAAAGGDSVGTKASIGVYATNTYSATEAGSRMEFYTSTDAGAVAKSLTLGQDQSADFTGNMTVGGGIDGTVIGGTTPAAGTFTTLTSNSIDGTVIGGTTPAAGTFTALTSNGIDDNAAATAMTIDSSGNVGVGTVIPSTPLEIVGSGQSLTFTGTASTNTGGSVYKTSAGVTAGIIDVSGTSGDIQIKSDPDNVMAGSSILMQVDGTTVVDVEPSLLTVDGDQILSSIGTTTTTERRLAVRSLGYAVLELSGDRANSAGEPGGAGATFGVDGTGANSVVSQINAAGTDGVGGSFTGTSADDFLVGTLVSQNLVFGTNRNLKVVMTGASFRPANDNNMSLGGSSFRWTVVYAASGTINTSDATTKQDIDVISEAETRVALACKGLMRKFRFIDAVEKKGDDARIHFGIIAQDLQAAFVAEGLDPNRYAMFCSDTWWEEDIVIPAYGDAPETTQRKVYETAEEATETATEVTRLGVRYSELLAFIIGAM